MTPLRAPFAARLAAIPVLLLALIVAATAHAQTVPSGEGTTIVVGNPNFQPTPIAIPAFISPPELASDAENIRRVVTADLERCGLFKVIPPGAYIARITDFNAVPQYADWRTVNAQALVTASVTRATDGRLVVQYRVFDTAAEEQIIGQQILADPADWRRVGHKLADGVYSKLTGEGPYFDSRIVFVAESGPKGDRVKRLAVMDVDGANVRYLPDASGLVLGPRFSPNDQTVLYTSYNTGQPELYLVDIDTNRTERLGAFPGMSFAPQFSPTGNEVVFSVSENGNTDIWAMDLATRTKRRLTRDASIETSPSYSPDGTQIVFESDRGGQQELYIMPASGGEARRISFGSGRYAAPVWSPKGDLIAFTKIEGSRFHIGVMRPDGSGERLLTTSFLDESPTFSPNGRVLMFSRETPGANGTSQVMSIDVTGINLRRVETPGQASDPAWSPLRK
ncbi:MAG TPA: Tol-Pal system beta propeller repeat protein TolB [Solirubrobacter sp.]|nr:Tol-Pal system beta propeller repeat protein TolB [Solirubrobacter sp.]